MRTSWEAAVDHRGKTIPNDFVGAIRREPDIKLFANNYCWRVEIKGVEARKRVTSPADLERHARWHKVEITPVDFAKKCSEAWAQEVIRKRDAVTTTHPVEE